MIGAIAWHKKVLQIRVLDPLGVGIEDFKTWLENVLVAISYQIPVQLG